MRHFYFACVAAALCVAVLSVAAWPPRTVTPFLGRFWSGDRLGGWHTSVGDNVPRWKFTVSGAGAAPMGLGAFHFFTEVLTGVDPLEKIYLGTNDFSGVALNSVTSFKYYTYLHSRNYDGGGGWPDGQPPMIEIITDKGSQSTDQRRFVFKPWGWWGGHDLAKDTWQEWDLMAEYASPRWQMVGSNASTDVIGNWSWVKTKYLGDMLFSTPNVGEYTGDPVGGKHANQSGTSISIKVGSGRAQDWMINPGLVPIAFEYKAWWRESCGIDAYADKLVIGINGVETVYDFEPKMLTAAPVAITPGSCRDSIIGAAKDTVICRVWQGVGVSASYLIGVLSEMERKKIKVIAKDYIYQHIVELANSGELRAMEWIQMQSLRSSLLAFEMRNWNNITGCMNASRSKGAVGDEAGPFCRRGD